MAADDDDGDCRRPGLTQCERRRLGVCRRSSTCRRRAGQPDIPANARVAGTGRAASVCGRAPAPARGQERFVSALASDRRSCPRCVSSGCSPSRSRVPGTVVTMSNPATSTASAMCASCSPRNRQSMAQACVHRARTFVSRRTCNATAHVQAARALPRVRSELHCPRVRHRMPLGRRCTHNRDGNRGSTARPTRGTHASACGEDRDEVIAVRLTELEDRRHGTVRPRRVLSTPRTAQPAAAAQRNTSSALSMTVVPDAVRSRAPSRVPAAAHEEHVAAMLERKPRLHASAARYAASTTTVASA